jgi:hypothetical protein
MINKGLFLSSIGCSRGKLATEINNLIFNWHKLQGIKVKANEIDKALEPNLRVAVNFWKNLILSETEGFRDDVGRLSFHKLLKEVINNDETINYFGVLCPSYKKGIGAIGFANEPGNTTYRAFANLERMAENTRALGIKCDTRMFFADISIENPEKFSQQDWEDFKKNIWLDSIIAKAHNVQFSTLIEFAPELGEIVGKTGKLINVNKINVSKKAFDRSLWRDRQFYPKNFGWTENEADKRTTIHAQSYFWQGEFIRKKFKYPVMVYSAYDYEKAGLYNGKGGDLWPCIIFPLKSEINSPTATIPKWPIIINKQKNYA